MGGTTILQTGWGEGTEHIQLSLKKRRQKEGEEEEEKLRLVIDKRKKEEEEKLRLVRHGFDIFRILSDTLLMCDSLAQMGRGKKSEGDVGDGQGNRGSV